MTLIRCQNSYWMVTASALKMPHYSSSCYRFRNKTPNALPFPFQQRPHWLIVGLSYRLYLVNTIKYVFFIFQIVVSQIYMWCKIQSLSLFFLLETNTTYVEEFPDRTLWSAIITYFAGIRLWFEEKAALTRDSSTTPNSDRVFFQIMYSNC